MSTPATLAHQAVEVNFNVEIDASGSLNVLGYQAPTVANVIIAEKTLPVVALYDASSNKGLLELWEPADAQNNIKVQLADSNLDASKNFTGAYDVTARKLVLGMERLLCDSFDCSGVAPFSDSKYTGKVEYTKPTDFGHVALSVLAHYMFGHVNATKAITNDVQYVTRMLNVTAMGADASATYANYVSNITDASGVAVTLANMEDVSAVKKVQGWTIPDDANNANLAARLVKALLLKGLSGEELKVSAIVDGAEPATTELAHIVHQVIGADASRAMNEDGSERTINQHSLLRFYAGDVIYVNIKIKQPSVTVGTGQGVTAATLQGFYSAGQEVNYALKITLA